MCCRRYAIRQLRWCPEIAFRQSWESHFIQQLALFLAILNSNTYFEPDHICGPDGSSVLVGRPCCQASECRDESDCTICRPNPCAWVDWEKSKTKIWYCNSGCCCSIYFGLMVLFGIAFNTCDVETNLSATDGWSWSGIHSTLASLMFGYMPSSMKQDFWCFWK